MPRWTDEARARQRELIRTWAPWEQSTGPVTRKGKRKAARNWRKGSRGSLLRMLRVINGALRDPSE
jgi:hypothetical protein